MQFSKAFVAALLYAGSAVAQIAFTQVPASIQAGSPATVRWGGGDDSPVTIFLQTGPAQDLQTVSLITGRATGTSFTFTLPKSLANGKYAFKISQGVDDVNYSGMFTFSGGSNSPGTTSLSLVSTITSSTNSASATSLQAAIASINSTISSLTAAAASGAKNATTTAFVPLGTGAVGSGVSSGATGTMMSRNTTMSMASLRSTSTGSATTTSGSSGSSSTSSAPSESSSSAAMPLEVAASPFALVLSAFMAVVYLG